MNRVSLSISLTDFMSLMDPSIETVNELQERLKKILSKEPDGKTRRPVGRPLQANHPYHTQEELKCFRDLLFAQERIGSDQNWMYDGKKPSRLAAEQDDMDPGEVRLDNGVIAVMNLDLEEIPPMPRFL